MKILNLKQGTDEWHAFRASHNTASEAPAMMGAHPNVKRNELLEQKALGTAKEYSQWVEEVLFAKGHKVEAAARPMAEKLVGDDLWPVSVVDDSDYLSASLDGLSLEKSVIWECKQWNQKKADDVAAGQLPEADRWQVVQSLVVTGAERCLYMVTDGTPANCVYLWAELNKDDESRLLKGWAQFVTDQRSYKPRDVSEVEGEVVDALPTLFVDISGEVKETNIATYEQAALARIEAINTDLKTDEDFANADKLVKFLDASEKEIEAVKARALAQAEPIDALFRSLDNLKEKMRAKRLDMDKAVKAKKTSLRAEIMTEGYAAVKAHIDQINESIDGRIMIPDVPADFAGVMKNKRTLATLHEAVDGEVARVKIEASMLGDKVRRNVKILQDETGEYRALFADAQQLVLKEPDDLSNAIKLRIAEHKEELAKKAANEAQNEPPAADPAPTLTEVAAPAPNVATRTIQGPPADESGKKPDRDTVVWLVANHYGMKDADVVAALEQIFSKPF